jgi:hypothetical protein
MSCAFGSHAWVYSHALDTGHTVYHCAHCGKDQWRDPGPRFQLQVTLDCGDTEEWTAAQRITWLQPGTTFKCSRHGERTVTRVEQEQVSGKEQKPASQQGEASDADAVWGCLFMAIVLIVVLAGCTALVR